MISCAVVLAGGRSRRYGSDKLAADVDGQPLLDRAIAGLHAGRDVIIVGPVRALTGSVHVRFVPDDHPDGGPAAAMITGLRAALEGPAELIMVLPGDAPGAGAAAELLATELADRPDAPGLLAIDRGGREQPLQLALRRPAAEQLVRLAGPDGAAGGSARRLVAPLDLPRHALAPAATWDIDTARQHRAWSLRDGDAVRAVRELIKERRPATVILTGADPDQVEALADALALAATELAGTDQPATGAEAAEDRFSRSLAGSPPHRCAAVRVWIGPAPVPDGIDLGLPAT